MMEILDYVDQFPHCDTKAIYVVFVVLISWIFFFKFYVV